MIRTKEAVNQPTVELNGFIVPLFGSLESKALAVVDLEVLKRITSFLELGNLRDIQNSFVKELEQTTTMQTYLLCIENELRFHKSVNEISKYKPEEEPNLKPIGEDVLH